MEYLVGIFGEKVHHTIHSLVFKIETHFGLLMLHTKSLLHKFIYWHNIVLNRLIRFFLFHWKLHLYTQTVKGVHSNSYDAKTYNNMEDQTCTKIAHDFAHDLAIDIHHFLFWIKSSCFTTGYTTSAHTLSCCSVCLI